MECLNFFPKLMQNLWVQKFLKYVYLFFLCTVFTSTFEQFASKNFFKLNVAKCNLGKVKLQANAISGLLLKRTWSEGCPRGLLLISWLTLHLTLAFFSWFLRICCLANRCGFWPLNEHNCVLPVIHVPSCKIDISGRVKSCMTSGAVKQRVTYRAWNLESDSWLSTLSFASTCTKGSEIQYPFQFWSRCCATRKMIRGNAKN